MEHKNSNSLESYVRKRRRNFKRLGLRIIFNRIRESDVKSSPTECKLMKTEVSYLRVWHALSKSVKTDKLKTEKISGSFLKHSNI